MNCSHGSELQEEYVISPDLASIEDTDLEEQSPALSHLGCPTPKPLKGTVPELERQPALGPCGGAQLEPELSERACCETPT